MYLGIPILTTYVSFLSLSAFSASCSFLSVSALRCSVNDLLKVWTASSSLSGQQGRTTAVQYTGLYAHWIEDPDASSV